MPDTTEEVPESGLLVTEIFKSVQGEGLSMGKPSVFIRLFGCMFACSWCDSKFSWLPEYKSQAKRMEPRDIAEQVPDGWNVVITGGEPLLWQKTSAFYDLLLSLHDKGCSIEVETAGAIVPTTRIAQEVDQWNVSPKLTSAGNHEAEAKHLETVVAFLTKHLYTEVVDDPPWEALEQRWQLKFVVSDDRDWDRLMEILAVLAAKANLIPKLTRQHVYVMPECLTREQHLAKQDWLMDKVKAHGMLNYSPRLHILMWDSKRGV